MHTGYNKLKKDEKSKYLVYQKFCKSCEQANHLASVCRSKNTAHKVVDNDIKSLLSILTKDKTKQTTLVISTS